MLGVGPVMPGRLLGVDAGGAVEILHVVRRADSTGPRGGRGTALPRGPPYAVRVERTRAAQDQKGRRFYKPGLSLGSAYAWVPALDADVAVSSRRASADGGTATLAIGRLGLECHQRRSMSPAARRPRFKTSGRRTWYRRPRPAAADRTMNLPSCPLRPRHLVERDLSDDPLPLHWVPARAPVWFSAAPRTPSSAHCSPCTPCWTPFRV